MTKMIPALPAHYYFDTNVYEKERLQIFGKQWIYVAHEEELDTAGSYTTLELAGYPIYIIRSHDGVIRAFHNICRHRGAPLLSKERGVIKKDTVSCPYHNWSYNSAGEFLRAPHISGGLVAECEKLHLFGIQVTVHKGLIFVNLDPQATPFLDDRSDLISAIDASDVDFADYRFHSVMERHGNFNWKAWIDGYQECYHCPTIHPVFNKDFTLRNYNIENRDRFSIHGCNRKRDDSASGAFQGIWLWVYPNLGMPCYEPAYYTLSVMPEGPGRTKLSYRFFARKNASYRVIEEFLEFIKQVTEEDISICERTQINLTNSVLEHGYLNPNRENGVEYFQSLIRSDVAQAQNPKI